jgi:hypothetical protein
VLACGTLLLLLRRMFWLFESLKEKKFLFKYRSDAHLFISKRELRSCLVVDRSRRRTRKHSATSPTLPCAASPPGSHVFFEPSDGRNKNKKRLKGMMVEESYGGGEGIGGRPGDITFRTFSVRPLRTMSSHDTGTQLCLWGSTTELRRLFFIFFLFLSSHRFLFKSCCDYYISFTFILCDRHARLFFFHAQPRREYVGTREWLETPVIVPSSAVLYDPPNIHFSQLALDFIFFPSTVHMSWKCAEQWPGIV